jgi:hypothetical protein
LSGVTCAAPNQVRAEGLPLPDHHADGDALHRVEGRVDDQEDQQGDAAHDDRRPAHPVDPAPHDKGERPKTISCKRWTAMKRSA